MNAPVAIVGGGIGGLTAALALHRHGIASLLFTKEKKWSESRGGAYLTKSAIRILDRLGLGSSLRMMGLSIGQCEVFSQHNRKLFTLNLNDFGCEALIVPRVLLRQAFLEQLPPDCVQFDRTFKRMNRSANDHLDGVSLVMRHGSNPLLDAIVRTDCLIGADGSRSSVRASLARPGTSRSTGVSAYRAIVLNSDHTAYPMHTAREVWGTRAPSYGVAGLRIGYARMTPDSVFWWASVGSAPGDVSVLQSIVLRPYRRKLIDHFEGFPDDVMGLIATTPEHDIERSEVRRVELGFRWVDVEHSSRVVLIGDAARQHDLPFFHHGPSLAVEDAYSLAYAISENRLGDRIQSGKALLEYAEERSQYTENFERRWRRFSPLASPLNPFGRVILPRALSAYMSLQEQSVIQKLANRKA